MSVAIETSPVAHLDKRLKQAADVAVFKAKQTAFIKDMVYRQLVPAFSELVQAFQTADRSTRELIAALSPDQEPIENPSPECREDHPQVLLGVLEQLLGCLFASDGGQWGRLGWPLLLETEIGARFRPRGWTEGM